MWFKRFSTLVDAVEFGRGTLSGFLTTERTVDQCSGASCSSVLVLKRRISVESSFDDDDNSNDNSNGPAHLMYPQFTHIHVLMFL